MKPVLYIFPISHFSEKARWALDLAAFDYIIKPLTPGEHIEFLKRITSESSVPVLELEKEIIQGSSKILDLVEIQAFGAKSSTNEIEMEAKMDNLIGGSLQTILYHFILGFPETIGKLLKLTPPTKEEQVPTPEKFDLISLALRRRYKINPKNVEAVIQVFSEQVNEIQNIYQNRKFFNGNSFGRVDLTIASLMGILVKAEESPASIWFNSVNMPEPFLVWRDTLGAESLFERLREFYSEFRTQSK